MKARPGPQSPGSAVAQVWVSCTSVGRNAGMDGRGFFCSKRKINKKCMWKRRGKVEPDLQLCGHPPVVPRGEPLENSLCLPFPGGYYLTSAYGALSLIKNFQEEQAARLLSSEARDTLRQWHKRRTTTRTVPSVDDFQVCVTSSLGGPSCFLTAHAAQGRPPLPLPPHFVRSSSGKGIF